MSTEAGSSRTSRFIDVTGQKRLERVLGYLLDEDEFLSPYGIRSLSRYHRDHPFVVHAGGQEHRVSYECPTGSGNRMTLFEAAREISGRLAKIFLRDEHGQRPVYGGTAKFQEDPYWRDLILFYEYFHGDNGAGLGASHQTGWTGAIARLLDLFGRLAAADVLLTPKELIEERLVREQVGGKD